ncbi:MAG: hypothetical protein KGI33_05725 [Thaumarchaeota archaeon]|nr:hypothetical protein [Nitrososphaerota archaeon]
MEERKQTESVSLRLDSKTWNKIKLFAKKQKVSPNALVGQILDCHIEWEVNSVAAGWIVMPKPFLVELFKLIDKGKIEKTISDLSTHMAKDMNLYMRGKHDLESWLSILRARAQRSGFNLTEYDDERVHEIVMQHDMGENWSRYFKIFYQNVFDDLGVGTEFDYTDNTLVIKINKNSEFAWHK